MLSLILAIVLFVYLAICTVWAVFLRKFKKTRVRFFGVLASFVVALVATFIAKLFLEGEDFAMNTVIPLIASGDATVAEFIASSDALRQTLIGTVSSLLAPALFLAFFLIANFLSWIVYLFMALMINAKKKGEALEIEVETVESPDATEATVTVTQQSKKKKDTEKTVVETLSTIAFAVGKVFIVFFVWMVPIVAYTSLVPAALEIFTETDILPEEERATFEQIVTDYVEPIENDPTINAFKYMGAGLVSDGLTVFRVGDAYVNLSHEVGALSHFGGCVIELTQNDFKEYDETDVEVFDHLSTSFEESQTLPAIVSEILYDATGAWLDGEAYMGVYYDIIRFDEQGMFDPFLDKSIEILHADTAPGRIEALEEDIHTCFDLFGVLIKHGVFANSEMHDNLIYNLARDGTVPEMIAVLEQNESMKALIPEITAIGVQAIGSALGTGGEEFDHVMESVTTELNSIKSMGTPEEQKEYVSDVLHAEFDREGLIVEEEVLQKYTNLMVDDLLASKGDEDVTKDDVVLFFAEHAWEIEQDAGEEIPDELPDDVLDDYLQ